MDIANYVGVTTGSLSNSLNLLNQNLIKLENNLYELAESMLARWLKLEYDKKGIYHREEFNTYTKIEFY